MRNDLPETFQESLAQLQPEAIVSLFRIELADKSAVFYLSPYQDVSWRGTVYSSVPCKMTGITMETEGKANRPTFTFVNPEGLFSGQVYEGKLDNAWITRLRILKQDLLDNLNAAVTESFRVSRVVSSTRALIVVELRDVLDGPSFKIPSRAFYPPEFPHVKLG